MTYRIRNIAVAVGLALVAALLTTFYVANYKRHVRQSEATVTVYVAKRDIPQGTPGADLVKKGWMTTADIATRSLVPGYITNPDQVRNLITSEDIYAGEQVSLRRFADHAEQGIRVQLHGTLRAISVPGTPDELLAGTLKDGDHVDVLANLKCGPNDCFFDRMVARDVLVLKAPTVSATAKVGSGSGSQATSAMLAVHDNKEAQKIWYAVQNASGWTLALRPVTKDVTSPEDVEGLPSMLKDDVTSKAWQHYLEGSPK
jgi:Flp pilus assembly protein CpaB